MDLGLKVPEEVGVLGVNNDELICDFAPVQISSVDDDEFKIGYEGAALLGRMMKGRKPPRQPLLVPPKGVVIRKSTDLLDIAKVPDRHVAAAARYIAENFQTNITTPELRNDNDPTLVQVMVRAPEMAHETIRAMLADQSLSSDMILLGPRARYSN
jgi:hypothetical protein